MEGSGKILASELRYMFRQGKDIENYMKIVQRLKELVYSAGLSGRLSGIWQEKAGLSGKAYTDNPVGYPTSGKKNQIRPNPDLFVSSGRELGRWVASQPHVRLVRNKNREGLIREDIIRK